jgi:hypothetical protein
MVAIFYNNRERIKLSPKNKFKVIRKMNDIRGIKFEGIILLENWNDNNDIIEAYMELEFRQPELFK